MMPDKGCKKNGHTLLELTVSVVILCVLVGVAVPGMTNMARRYRAKEAIAVLRSVQNHMRTERARSGAYNVNIDGGNITTGAVSGNVPGITQSDLTGNYFIDTDYTITAVSPGGFTATASGRPGSEVDGITISINELGTLTEAGY